jgi:2-C-methyl-D-erythritol 4-phosphate cytidylyltransferase
VPKAFIHCAGRELWEWSAEVLARECDRVVFAVPPDRVVFAVPPDRVDAPAPGIERVAGGAMRSESVRHALETAPDATIVVVHDAARPMVTAELVRACVAEIEAGWDAAIAATPVTDTIKEADADGQVQLTLERRHLWAVQTPQAFEAGILRRALEADPEATAAATDDASLVEAVGGRVRVVEAPPGNFKITWPEDLERAEALLC